MIPEWLFILWMVGAGLACFVFFAAFIGMSIEWGDAKSVEDKAEAAKGIVTVFKFSPLVPLWPLGILLGVGIYAKTLHRDIEAGRMLKVAEAERRATRLKTGRNY